MRRIFAILLFLPLVFLHWIGKLLVHEQHGLAESFRATYNALFEERPGD